MATTFDDVDRRLRELEASLPRPSIARRPVARPLDQVLADLASLEEEAQALRARRAGTAPPPARVRDEPSLMEALVIALESPPPVEFDALAAWDQTPSSPSVPVMEALAAPVVIEDELELDLVLAPPAPPPATAEAPPDPIELDADLDADLDAVISVTSPSMPPMPESELPSRLSAVALAPSSAPAPVSPPPPPTEDLELDLFDLAPGALVDTSVPGGMTPSEHSDIRPVAPSSANGDLDEEAIELDLFDLEDVRNSEERVVAHAPRKSQTSTRAPPPLPPSAPPGERDSVPPERSLLGRLLRR